MSDSTSPSRPLGVSHMVLNVRDIALAERFWVEMMGFEPVGALAEVPGLTMRFYRGGSPGHHHDLALAEVRHADDLPPAAQWTMAPRAPGLNHVAIAYPDRETWLRQVAHLQASGITFHQRGEHGMAHSVYISDPDGHGIEVLYDLPESVWHGDLNAALNYFKPIPTDGEAALEDGTDNPVFSS